MKFYKPTWQHLAILLSIIFVIVLYRNAWISDDAYITFRTVDNFINGYGLTWNIAERVQTYTHPLWMLLISSIYWITNEAFYSSLFLSVIISVIAVSLLVFRVAKSSYIACLVLVALILSKAFVDYSTSGLENPLSHFLAIIFFMVFLMRPLEKKTIIYLSLIAALAGLNRMDCLLIFSPVFVYIILKDFQWKKISYIFMGFIPLLMWELFSLFYYGFFFSNTAYAKLTNCVPATELMGQGLYYLWSSITVDPVTMLIIIAGLIVPIVTKQGRLLLIACGVLLYLLYVIWIGGCFMSGRFLTVPFILSIIILSQYRFDRPKAGWWLPGLIILILGLSVKLSPVYTTAEYGTNDEFGAFGRGVVDERGCYYQASSLLNISKIEPMPAHRYARLGRTQNVPFMKRGTIGYYGYYAGPDTYIIDIYGLSNALLARLPCDATQEWRIGHNQRTIPEGFPKTLITGKNFIEDKNIAAYYDKLSFIVSGDLYSWDRILTIIKFNLGSYDLDE